MTGYGQNGQNGTHGSKPRPRTGIAYEAEEVEVPLNKIATMANPSDNCAIATSCLPQGTRFSWKGSVYRLSHTILEGHRFAIERIAKGENLKSWSLPFGCALRPIQQGEYCCNTLMLKALKGRRDVHFKLPEEPNFSDPDTSASCPYQFDESAFVAGKQADSIDGDLPGTFQGFARNGGRGVGTRNKVVLIGLTVSSASFVRALEATLQSSGSSDENIDGIVAVAHNEGESKVQNNKELLMRTIAGFLVHPNTGSALVVSTGQERHITVEDLKTFLSDYPTAHVPHQFLELSGNWHDDLKRAGDVVQQVLLPRAAEYKRTAQPVSALRIALQCGGSDAFSGITGNPLVGEVSKLLLTRGGLALLAESPELVGAEPYVLANCRSLEIARKFLMMTERYKQYASRHGQDAAGNPSGGNLFRGLYNIVIKSLGASHKKPPDVCLDQCIDYSERVREDESGYYFMDSPGNDLESIAGQVASGCNVIFFVTGNGAITNFPFVPTLKVVTTSGRFNILEKDMDINAGLLNEGLDMQSLAAKVFKNMVGVASGEKTKGELAKISQVSIWRNWFLDDSKQLSDLQAEFNFEQKDLHGPGLKVKQEWLPSLACENFVKDIRYAKDSSTLEFLPPVSLILPTSLCSSEVARLASSRLNSEIEHADDEQARFVALPHSEGCGGAGGQQFETIFQRVMLGHLLHPQVQHGFLLEHGCEKTHNDWFAERLSSQGISMDTFGWASVQADGGIEAVYDIIKNFFKEPHPRRALPAQALRLALLGGEASPQEAEMLATLVRYVVLKGGTVVLPSSSPLLVNRSFTAACLFEELPEHVLAPTVAYAQPPPSGLHVMEVPSMANHVEIISGIAPTVHCFLVWNGKKLRPLQAAHPFVPTLHVAAKDGTEHPEVDATVELMDVAGALQEILAAIQGAVHGAPTKASRLGATDFSVTRGITSVSL